MTGSNWVTDPFQGSPAAAEATDAARARDHDRLADAFESAAASELAILMLRVAEVPAIIVWLVDLLADDPDDPWLNAITAEAHLNEAWEIRRITRERDLTDQERFQFFLRAEAAADIIRHARSRGEAPIGLAALRAVQALGGTPEEVHLALAEADAVHPHDYIAVRRGLEYFAPRWHGDIRLLWDFAEARSAGAADGSPAAAIAAGAVVEQLVWAPKDRGGQSKGRMTELLDEAVIRTVDHPLWQWSPSGWDAANELVLANLVAGRTGTARELHARLTAARRTRYPWELLSPIRRTKHFALLSGS